MGGSVCACVWRVRGCPPVRVAIATISRESVGRCGCECEALPRSRKLSEKDTPAPLSSLSLFLSL